MIHLLNRLLRWLTAPARIEGATTLRHDPVSLTAAARRAHPGVFTTTLERAVRGAIYDGLKAGQTIEQTSQHIAKLWRGEIDCAVIERRLRDELKRLTRVPVIRVLDANTVELAPRDTVDEAVLLDEFGRHRCRWRLHHCAGGGTVWVPEAEEVDAVDEPLEGVKSPPAQRTEPTDRVWGPSPIRGPSHGGGSYNEKEEDE